MSTDPAALGLRMYQATNGSWMNLVLAGCLLALVPAAIVIGIAQRDWRQGLE